MPLAWAKEKEAFRPLLHSAGNMDIVTQQHCGFTVSSPQPSHPQRTRRAGSQAAAPSISSCVFPPLLRRPVARPIYHERWLIIPYSPRFSRDGHHFHRQSSRNGNLRFPGKPPRDAAVSAWALPLHFKAISYRTIGSI